MENRGLSRFKKFEYIYKYILKEPLSERKSRELGERFSELVYEGIMKAPLVNGAQVFLEKYHMKLLLFIASGTPQEEMRDIVNKRGLTPYFQAVYGSPTTKAQICAKILKDHDLRNRELIFVGDAITDRDGANENDI